MVTDVNLLAPGECEKPFPVPPLERTYRIYVPLLDLTTPDGETRLAPPATLGSMLRFNAVRAARLDTANDVFGGVPLNHLDKAGDDRWSEPVLKPVEVRDPAALVRTMSVTQGKNTVALSLSAAGVSELLATGETLAPRTGGGFVKLQLSADAPRPLVHQVDDLSVFLADPAVITPEGVRRVVRLASRDLSKMATGAPVVSGSGAGATILYQAAASSTGGGLTSPPTRDTSTPGGTPPPPTGSTTGGSNVPPRKPEVAALLPLDQTWLLLTYERGKLISSISLTPQEEVTIDVYSWDRRKSGREDTTSFDAETNADAQSVDRDTRDVFSELTRTGNFNWGLNGGFSGDGVTIGGNAGSGQTVNNIARKTQQTVQEQTIKASSKVQSSRQLKITESTEVGSETRVTRKLRNNNLCHAVTYHYFELDARYRVSTQFVKPEVVYVLLVDNPLAQPNYDIDFIRTYETVFRRALLDPAEATGFDAARTLWMLAHAAPVICNDCPCPGDVGGSEETAAFTSAVAAVRALGTAVSALLRDAAALSWTSFFNTLVPIAGSTVHDALPVNLNLALRKAMFVDAMTQSAPGVLTTLNAICAPFLSGTPTAAQLTAFNTQFAAIDLSTLDAALTPAPDLQTAMKGLVESRIRSAYAGMAKASVQTLMAGNATGNPFIDGIVSFFANIALTENSAAGAIVNAILGDMGLSPGFGATDANGVKQLGQTATTALAAWLGDTQQDAKAAAQARQNHQSTFATVFPPATVLAAQERFDALIRHLRAYSDYYANVVITDLVSRGQFPLPPVLAPYVGFIGLQPLTVVGGRLAYALDLSVGGQFGAAQAILAKLVDQIPDDAVTGEAVLPTPGFVVEPKLSCCSGCEDYVEESRQVDLDLRRAQVEQARREAERRAQRLAANPPQLEPFEPVEPHLAIDLTQPATKPTP